MSIDAAIGRIDQIITLQQQILDPSAATAAGSSGPSPGTGSLLASAADSGGAGLTGATGQPGPMTAADQATFANMLSSAESGSAASALSTDPSQTSPYGNLISPYGLMASPYGLSSSGATPSPYSGLVSPYSGLVSPYPAGFGPGYGSPYQGASPSPSSGYVNPLAGASVRAERIDQGVDYAGTGVLGAIGPGVVTSVTRTGSGWEGGGYVEYQLTAGPYAGRHVYYSEGVTPTVSVGETLAPGQPVATLIPGWSTGIEIGFAAGRNQASYANIYGGGYGEGALTAAGLAFSNLIASLGGPAGLAEGRSVFGHFP